MELTMPLVQQLPYTALRGLKMPAGNTYEAIASTSVATSTATITFSSIPATYTDLVLIITGKTSAGADIWIRVNGDTGSNYSYAEIDSNGTTVSASKAANQSNGLLTDWWGTPANDNSHICICQLNSYSSTVHHKTMISRANRAGSGLDFVQSKWSDTSAITSLTLRFSGGTTFEVGTVASLYGIKAA